MPQKKLEGIKGWLLLFVILMYLNSVFMIFLGFYGIFSYEGKYPLDAFLVLGPAILLGVLHLISAIFLSLRKRFAVKYTIFTLWFRYVLLILMIIIFNLTSLKASDDAVFALSSTETFVFAIVWTVYLIRSKRVENTFTR